MRSIDDRMARRVPGTFRRLGAETIIIRRNSTLESVRAGATVRDLVLAADAIETAMAVTLELRDGGTLKGALLAGTKLQIEGNTYTVQSTIIAGQGATVLADVGLEEALTASASQGAAVTITSGPAYTWIDGLVLADGRRDDGADLGAEVSMVVSLPRLGAGTTPIAGDSIERPKTGFVGRISEVPESVGAAWDVKVGPAASFRPGG